MKKYPVKDTTINILFNHGKYQLAEDLGENRYPAPRRNKPMDRVERELLCD